MIIKIFLLAIFALAGFINSAPSPTTIYSNKQILVEPDIYVLYWNYTDTDIIFEIHARTTGGWVGFGISPNGDMVNSNVIIVWIDSNGTVNFTERNTLAGLVTPAINKEQVWTPLLTKALDGYLISKSTRKIKMCNTTDERLDIEAGTPHVIFAWSDNFANNEAAYHGNNRNSKTLPLLSSLNLKINLNMSQVVTTDFRVNVN